MNGHGVCPNQQNLTFFLIKLIICLCNGCSTSYFLLNDTASQVNGQTMESRSSMVPDKNQEFLLSDL